MPHTAVAIVLAAALGLWAPVAGAQQPPPMTDEQFVKDAAESNIAEVELGRLATQRAIREPVRQFGQRMVTDHSAMNAELMQLAQKKGMTPPTTLDARKQQIRDRLASVQGAEFDRAYMQEMLADHTKDVAHFQHYVQTGQDPELKALAAKSLPVLEQHLQLARDIHTQVALGPPPPAASPATTTVIVAPRTAAARPWCNGAYAPTAGTNFAACPAAPAAK